MSEFFTSGGQSIGVSASPSVLPMNIPEQISFRMDLLDLLAVQGTVKSFLQYHSSKASILKEISPEYSLEGLMLKLKLQYFGRLM